MSNITPGMEGVLKRWFERAITNCGQDPKAYDFDAEVDRGITYRENRAKFEEVIARICGPKPLSKREKAIQLLKSEEESTRCPACSMGFHYSKKLKSTAQEQYKSHLAYERSLGRLPGINPDIEKRIKAAQERAEKERAQEFMEQQGEY